MKYAISRSLRGAASAAVLGLAVTPSASADIIAFDMVGSASQNLVSYTNVWTDEFSSPADGFQIYRRGVSATIPFAVLDDSLSIFPPDDQGIIDETNTDTFFGVADTVNNDTSGPVSAQWDFDVAGFTDLILSMDMGAMGNFESSDVFSIGYALDGGAVTTLFEGIADESLSQEYIMAGGDAYDLDDPMTVAGTILTNQLQTFSASIMGTASTLSIILTANLNGSDEALAFQNLIIEGTVAASEPAIVALIGVGLLGFGLARRRA